MDICLKSVADVAGVCCGTDNIVRGIIVVLDDVIAACWIQFGCADHYSLRMILKSRYYDGCVRLTTGELTHWMS